jgi:hypothetical protein
MRLLILRQTSIAGQPARVGDVVEVNDRDARLLINNSKAEPAPAAPVVEPVAQDPEPIQRKPRTRRTKTNGTA